MELPAKTGAEIIVRARTAEREEQIRAEWTSLLPWMQSGHLKLMQWRDYYDARTGRNIDTRPAGDIIAELEQLHGGRLV